LQLLSDNFDQFFNVYDDVMGEDDRIFQMKNDLRQAMIVANQRLEENVLQKEASLQQKKRTRSA
jgi:hypothetical protein